MKRSLLNSPRLLEIKKKRQKIFLRKLYFLGFGIVVLLSGAVYLSRMPRVNIAEVNIAGGNVTSTDEVRSLVESEIAGKYLWLIPKSNLFFYPRKGIKDKLMQEFTRIKNVELEIQADRTLAVSFEERTGEYIWCGDAPAPEAESLEATSCYFLDEEGFVFAEAPYFSGEVYFKLYGGAVAGGGVNPIGSHFSEMDFHQYIFLVETMQNIGLRPVALYVPPDGNAKILLSSEGSGTSPEIMFKIDSDFAKLAENLQSALSAEPLQSDFKNKYSSLLYIDLRFGNKVYYKFRE